MQDFLIAAYKPPFVSSNAFLSTLKRHFNNKKAGFLGTLDPFAKGTLVVGFGRYTRLFPHLYKAKKTYIATLWLGAKSASLDIENIESISVIKPFSLDFIGRVVDSIKGEISFSPPLFSAKHIDGTRAYKLARQGKDISLPMQKMQVFDIKVLLYNHPFLTFSITLSEGGYVRSIGEMIASRLGVNGALSSLERKSEGDMKLDSTKIIKKEVIYSFLNPLDFMPYKNFDFKNLSIKDIQILRENIYKGAKMEIKNAQKGTYIMRFCDFFSIIEILESKQVKYILNRMPYVNSLTETR